MARIEKFDVVLKDRARVHDAVECTVSSFIDRGEPYLQIDTYGRSGRQEVGKVSQSIQLERNSARLLRDLIDKTFT